MLTSRQETLHLREEESARCIVMCKTDIDEQLMTQLVSEGVNLDRMQELLDALNQGQFQDDGIPDSARIPDISHPSIIDRRSPAVLRMSAELVCARFTELELPFTSESVGVSERGMIRFDEGALRRIGVFLYPKTAFGVLNGGCASSYVDEKKNHEYNAAALEKNRALFESLAQFAIGKPKGITPAYINPDGTDGYSFLLLKLRMLLEHKKIYQDMTGFSPCGVLPAFQLTSYHTDEAIQKAFREYILLPELKDLSDSLGCPAIEMYTETQCMMAAITHSSEGYPRRIFDRAYGKAHTGIALPGGHGQNFENLAHIYRKMHSMGIRYAWIGNIDNMGYTVDPVSLAIFALSGKDAAFEQSYRTPMDVKGGILITDGDGRFTCADIGPVLKPEALRGLTEQGKPVLFNCGTGLFDLEKLIPMLPTIPLRLPHRVTDQDKAAGHYAQVEQITWEIIGLLDDPLFFAVEKNRRFIGAKYLLETIMTSFPPDRSFPAEIREVALSLHSGLMGLLESEYGLNCVEGRWQAARSENARV